MATTTTNSINAWKLKCYDSSIGNTDQIMEIIEPIFGLKRIPSVGNIEFVVE